MIVEKIREIIAHHADLEHQMASPEVTGNPHRLATTGREYNALSRNLPTFKEYDRVCTQFLNAKELLKTEQDGDMIALIKDEITQTEAQLPELEQKIQYLLAPRDPNDDKNALMEIRPGTGGTEAGIFAADMFRMYCHYLDAHGWKYEVLSSNYGDLDAIKEIIFLVTGEGAYGTLKFESGIHRVQRVPDTEAQGRVHTSAATVVVMPEADDVEVTINPLDLRIDTYRASGAGGQHVNKTESAIRIVHIPTGLTVTCQDEKSQHKNRARAMKVLQTRLYEQEQKNRQKSDSETRKSIVGSGDRSEKIRTYSFPQNRITDHRINVSLYSLDRFINGDIQGLIDLLTKADLDERITQSEA